MDVMSESEILHIRCGELHLKGSLSHASKVY